MSKSNLPKKESPEKKGLLGKRPREKSDGAAETTEKTQNSSSGADGSELFTRRLQKSKLKELSLKLREA